MFFIATYPDEPLEGGLQLVPFVPESDVPTLREIMLGSPYGVGDKDRENVAEVVSSVLKAPDAVVFASVCGPTRGFPYFTQIDRGRTAWVHGYARPQHPSVPGRAIRLACRFAFERWKLNKIFTEHALPNRGASLVCRKAGFKQEGVITASRYHGGQPLDTVVFGLSREVFYGE